MLLRFILIVIIISGLSIVVLADNSQRLDDEERAREERVREMAERARVYLDSLSCILGCGREYRSEDEAIVFLVEDGNKENMGVVFSVYILVDDHWELFAKDITKLFNYRVMPIVNGIRRIIWDRQISSFIIHLEQMGELKIRLEGGRRYRMKLEAYIPCPGHDIRRDLGEFYLFIYDPEDHLLRYHLEKIRVEGCRDSYRVNERIELIIRNIPEEIRGTEFVFFITKYDKLKKCYSDEIFSTDFEVEEIGRDTERRERDLRLVWKGREKGIKLGSGEGYYVRLIARIPIFGTEVERDDLCEFSFIDGEGDSDNDEERGEEK